MSLYKNGRTKKLYYIWWLFLPLLAFTSGDSSYREIKNVFFSRGEEITYKVHYSFMNAAEGKMVISDTLFKVNGRVCYKVEVQGRSTGMFDMLMKIRDKWGSYIDTSAIISHKSYRILREGKYRKHEIVKVDQRNRKVNVRTYGYSDKKWKDERIYHTAANVQDLISGYYYLRTLDFTHMKPGHNIVMDAFFEDSTYHFKMKFLGREMVKSKLGKKKALVLSPEMPKNSLFDGKNSIKVWISDDDRKIPLKVKASMFVGAVEIDLKDYKRGRKN